MPRPPRRHQPRHSRRQPPRPSRDAARAPALTRCSSRAQAEEVELEEEVPPLGALGGDAPVATPMEEEEVPAWTTKVYNKQGADYAIAIAKSYRWPGAYSVAMKADKAANLYIGYGHENTGTTFTPVAPPPIMGEAADVEEQADVTLDAENALLKSIEESKMKAEGEDPTEEE